MNDSKQLLTVARAFAASQHIVNVSQGEWFALFDEDGNRLPGIRSRVGVAADTLDGREIGIDFIEMEPGSAFALHVHPGDHILFVIDGEGIVHVDGVDHFVTPNDSIFIAAEYPHGVKTKPGYDRIFRFLAVGYPHKHVSAADRMKLVR